jgi:osmotically-inducible protein OsmY
VRDAYEHDGLTVPLCAAGIAVAAAFAAVLLTSRSAVSAETVAPGASVRDRAIEERARHAIDDAPSLRDTGIHVRSVESGVVVLAGEALTLDDQVRALQIAWGVPAVRWVASSMRGPETFTDRDRALDDVRITAQAQDRLAPVRLLPDAEVGIDTEDAVVTLYGTVPTRRARAAAERLAWMVDGVRAVQNELRPPGSP